jgi:hypothetical protein
VRRFERIGNLARDRRRHVAAVQPTERRLHDRRDNLDVADSESESVLRNHDGWKRHPNWQREGGEGGRLHSRCRRAGDHHAPRKVSPSIATATSTALKSDHARSRSRCGSKLTDSDGGASRGGKIAGHVSEFVLAWLRRALRVLDPDVAPHRWSYQRSECPFAAPVWSGSPTL